MKDRHYRRMILGLTAVILVAGAIAPVLRYHEGPARALYIGEYFIHYRHNLEFLKTQFANAHYNYVKDGGTTYRMDNLRGSLGDKGEKYLPPLCSNSSTSKLLLQ